MRYEIHDIIIKETGLESSGSYSNGSYYKVCDPIYRIIASVLHGLFRYYTLCIQENIQERNIEVIFRMLYVLIENCDDF